MTEAARYYHHCLSGPVSSCVLSDLRDLGHSWWIVSSVYTLRKQKDQIFSTLCLDKDYFDLWLHLQITHLLSFSVPCFPPSARECIVAGLCSLPVCWGVLRFYLFWMMGFLRPNFVFVKKKNANDNNWLKWWRKWLSAARGPIVSVRQDF